MRALHLRLTAAFAALLLFMGLALLVLLGRTSQRYADELRQRLDAGIAMYVVRELSLVKDGRLNQLAIRELANRAMTLNPSAEVYLLNRDGVVLSDVVQHGQRVRQRVSLDPIRAFLSSPDDRPIYGDDPSSAGGRRVFTVAALQLNGSTDGYLYVVLGSQPERSLARRLRGSYALRAAGGAILLLLVGAIVISAGLFAMLTRRLRALDRNVQSWSTNFSGQLPLSAALSAGDTAGTDEIATLTRRFRAMSLAIERQIAELQQVDLSRRELIATVSHDLRSPLTTLRGHLETLQLTASGAQAKSLRHHLQVAVRQVDQLGRLIDALFELAQLESGVLVPTIEPVHIADLLQDLAIRYKVLADRKSLELRLALDTRGVTVMADIGLLERALGNLLDNALRHTARGGLVCLEMTVEADRVRLQVIDTGEGMETEDCARNLDRRRTWQRQGSGQRAGLGLAIVQRIVDLHAQQLSIISKRGSGTTVEFALRRADCHAAASTDSAA